MALLHLNSEGASGELPFQGQLFKVHVLLHVFRPGHLFCFFCIASATRMLDLHAGGPSLFITCKCSKIYGAMAIKSVHVIAQKTIMTVEVAGLSGSRR